MNYPDTIDTDKKAGDAFYEFLRPFLNSEHAERISILHDAVMPKMKKDGESLQSEARLKKAAAERGMSLWQYIYTTALTKLREAVEADPDLSAFLQANPSQSPRQPEPDVHTEKSPGTRLPKSARDNARRFRRRQGVMSFAASLREKGGLPESDNDVPHVRALMDLLKPFWGGEHEAEMWGQYKNWTRLTDDDRAAYQAEAEMQGVSLREYIFSIAHKYITDYISRRPHLREIAWPPDDHRRDISRPNDDDEIITTPVALDRYCVTERTLSRHIRNGELTDHRREGHERNAVRLFSDRELSKKFKRKSEDKHRKDFTKMKDPTIDLDNQYISLEVLAGRIGLPKTFLRRKYKAGLLPFLPTGRGPRFLQADVLEALRRVSSKRAATENLDETSAEAAKDGE